MHLATIFQDGVAHILDDTWQTVCSYVGMGIHQYVRTGTMLHKDVQDSVAIATLLASGVQLAVAIGTGSAFAKGVVALRVNTLFRTYSG